MAAPAPNSAQAMPEYKLVCKVCEKQFAKYECPQCNLRYCSLECYKRHNLRCTESFARKNVTEELRSIRVGEESQRSMMEALKRIHFDEEGRSVFEDEFLTDEAEGSDDAEDGEGTVLSERTLELIEEGNDVSLDDLSSKERKAFFRAIAKGEISPLIPPWNPWWLDPLARTVSITAKGTSLVQNVTRSDPETTEESETASPEGAPGAVPAPPSEALARVRHLTRMDPSPSLSILVAEVVYSYCCILRFYNGDWKSEPSDAASSLLSVSRVLGQAAPPESVGLALSEVVKTLCSPAFSSAGGFKFAAALFDDSAAVLRLGRPCVVCALADLHRMLETAKSDLKDEMESEMEESTEHHSNGVNAPSSDKRNVKSTMKTKMPSTESEVTQHSCGKIGRERDSGFDSRETKDTTRCSQGIKSVPRFSEEQTKTASSRSQDSRQSGAFGYRTARKSFRMGLKKLTAAIRKVYFLMCWTNEQPNEVFLSLASLIHAEKDRQLEIVVVESKLEIAKETKAPVKKSGPVIKEISQDRRVVDSGQQDVV